MNEITCKRVLVGVVLAGSAGAARAQPVQWSNNGHFYELVSENGNWSSARTAAESRSWFGVNGHLVSITSAAENLFLTSAFGDIGLHLKWTGGMQAAGAPEPGGGWSWTTGEALSFSGWNPGEPNNAGGLTNENAIVFDHNIQPWGKPWNDYDGNAILGGFVVEYPIPSPGSLAVLGLVAGFGARRSHRSNNRTQLA